MFIFIQDVSNKKMVLLTLWLLSFALLYEHIHPRQQAQSKEHFQDLRIIHPSC